MADENIVLLKNEGNILPLNPAESVSVFGRCQNDWFYVGYGSGGDVHPPYRVNLMEGLEKAGVNYDRELADVYKKWCEHPDNQPDHGWWGHWPYFYEEMPLDERTVQQAAKKSEVALIVIGRAAGEDRENTLTEGSYYLTAKEKAMLKLVSQYYKKTVLLLNTGNIMDLSFIAKYRIAAVLQVWQLGQESGNAVADVLTGQVNPSGKLPDTIAKTYADYPSSKNFGNKEFNNYEEDIFVGYRYFSTFCPEKVLYPFGFGLSYTTFDIETLQSVRMEGHTVLTLRVTNTGNRAGKEVVQVYCEPPAGKLAKAKRNLVAYQKTALLNPGESQTLTLKIADYDCASFDDCGITGPKDAFVLEPGEYHLYIGNCSTADELGCTFRVDALRILRQCQDACNPEHAFHTLRLKGTAPVNPGGRDLRQRILDRLPEEIAPTGDRGILLTDVKAGKHSLDEFVAQLTDKELADLTRGQGFMGSPLGIAGNAGAFGGITEDLRSRGIPPLITADGPAGLRIRRHTSLLPCGTAIASAWNVELTERLFQKEGEEATHFGVDVLLSPGMNIHRNPLCGRNFEYYSEDPLLCGKTAAAAVRGIQAGGASACPKHFACNNQEVNRNHNDSRVSQRALREIYLKCFEICVKEGKPQNLMTSYNKVNGVWSHYNYDLATTILREEWGYEGNVITDWWMRSSRSPEFPNIRDSAYRVRAQVDVLMPGGASYGVRKYVFDKDILSTLGQPGGITRAELQRSAGNVLRFALTRMDP
jgi:beta-glucosidase